jgi:hypothetical protein
MRTFIVLFIFVIAAAEAQERSSDSQKAPPLLQELAAMKSAEWDALFGSLDAKLLTMPLCDARVPTTIEELSRASAARLVALTQHMNAAAAQAKSDAGAARKALSGEELISREMETERAEAQQQQAAAEAQIAELAESEKRREVLDGTRKKLEAIGSALRERVTAANKQVERRIALTTALRELVEAYEARQHAIEAGVIALNREKLRWSEYYDARLARAQTECWSISNAINEALSHPSEKKQNKK